MVSQSLPAIILSPATTGFLAERTLLPLRRLCNTSTWMGYRYGPGFNYCVL